MENIELNSKQLASLAEVMQAGQQMATFQALHNRMRESFNGLLAITNSFAERNEEYQILIKACLVDLFALIEADIHHYAILDRPPRQEEGGFTETFQSTFHQIANTWNKQEIANEYIRTKWSVLLRLRRIRNRHVHPKTTADLFNPTRKHLRDITACFNDYNEMVAGIMDNFFVGTTISAPDFFKLR